MERIDRTNARPITLRLTVIEPPAGVTWAVQLGREALLPPATVTRDRVIFDVSLELVASSSGGPRLRGAAVQGPSGGRFLYVNSGSRAGEPGSCWDRRAKVSLVSIPMEELHERSQNEQVVLHGEIAGTAKDGGPACASVPLLRTDWVVATRTG